MCNTEEVVQHENADLLVRYRLLVRTDETESLVVRVDPLPLGKEPTVSLARVSRDGKTYLLEIVDKGKKQHEQISATQYKDARARFFMWQDEYRKRLNAKRTMINRDAIVKIFFGGSYPSNTPILDITQDDLLSPAPIPDHVENEADLGTATTIESFAQELLKSEVIGEHNLADTVEQVDLDTAFSPVLPIAADWTNLRIIPVPVEVVKTQGDGYILLEKGLSPKPIDAGTCRIMRARYQLWKDLLEGHLAANALSPKSRIAAISRFFNGRDPNNP